jgi:uncharacterized phiE125 gp8 family phage protein
MRLPFKTALKTAPATEPITLVEAETQLRLDAAAFTDTITTAESIAPGSHTVATAYTLIGSAVDRTGLNTLVQFVSGTNGASGTVDVKIQDSDDNTTFTDWATGAFTQVTTANNNAAYSKEYTGAKKYIRVVATVAVAACEFGVNIITSPGTRTEATQITSLIKTVRQYCESVGIWKTLITQTWYMYLDKFPAGDGSIMVPKPPLQKINSIKYTDCLGTETTLSTDVYEADTAAMPGLIKLKYGQSWPSDDLKTVNPIVIDFDCGYGATIASCPDGDALKQIMLLHLTDLFEQRGSIKEGAFTELPWLNEMYTAFKCWY